MKILHILILAFILGCDNGDSSGRPEKETSLRQPSLDEIFKRSYDIPDLKSYNDSSKYIALYTTCKPYNNIIVIEFSEIANRVNLCIKQPVIKTEDPTYDSLWSLPFNQLCYCYVDDEAKKIKNSFELYQSGKVSKDITCPRCFDPEVWTVEIYDHGVYSSTTKDYLSPPDRTFIDSLFAKVRLSEKNGYTIKY